MFNISDDTLSSPSLYQKQAATAAVQLQAPSPSGVLRPPKQTRRARESAIMSMAKNRRYVFISSLILQTLMILF